MSAWETTGKSDDWWTPCYIFDALGTTFDMDVATAFDAATHVPAHEKIYRNSLAQTWRGFIWCNAPFGKRNGIQPWLEKFFTHGDGIALVPDRTSAPWFKEAAYQSSAILFISPKVKFERPDGTLGKSPSTGTALIAKGQKSVNALVNARGAGLGWMCRVS